jgi:hypothetical protein
MQSRVVANTAIPQGKADIGRIWNASHCGMCRFGAAFFVSGLIKNTFLCDRFPVK